MHNGLTLQLIINIFDAPANSLKDSNASLNVKTMEEGVGLLSLIYSTSGVTWACWNSGVGTRTSDKWVNYSYGPTQIK